MDVALPHYIPYLDVSNDEVKTRGLCRIKGLLYSWFLIV